jgi:hypothetical protein
MMITFQRPQSLSLVSSNRLPTRTCAYKLVDYKNVCWSDQFCLSLVFAVARGRIVKTVENNALKQTRLSVRVTKTLRTLQGDPTLSEEELENVIPAPTEANVLHLVVGQHCGARQGEGEFVFMARRKLGDLTLACAPRLDEWVRVQRRLSRSGAAECILHS